MLLSMDVAFGVIVLAVVIGLVAWEVIKWVYAVARSVFWNR